MFDLHAGDGCVAVDPLNDSEAVSGDPETASDLLMGVTGFEPVEKALQAVASPLGHPTVVTIPSGRRDSNPRPSPWQGDALPAALRPHRRRISHPATVGNSSRPPTRMPNRYPRSARPAG